MDCYGTLPSSGHSSMEADEQLPPYPDRSRNERITGNDQRHTSQSTIILLCIPLHPVHTYGTCSRPVVAERRHILNPRLK
jgi:hypothetical protein